MCAPESEREREREDRERERERQKETHKRPTISGSQKSTMDEPFGCLVLQQLVREAIDMKQTHQGNHVDVGSQNEHCINDSSKRVSCQPRR